VVAPTAVNVSGPSVSSSQISFNYSTDAGLSYVIESSSNLTDWVSVATNVASGDSAAFSGAFNSTATQFYRVGLLPNP
jgi:hypothetical protein